MEKSKERESLPANVYNDAYSIFGLDCRKVVGLMVTVIISSLVLRFRLLYFLAIMVSGFVLSLVTVDGHNLGIFLIGKLVCLKGGREGIIELSYRSLPSDRGILLYDGTHVYQFIRINDVSVNISDNAELAGFPEALSRVIGEIESDIDFLSFPTLASKSSYKVPEDSEAAIDYNGLIDFAFEGCYYMESYVILKRRYKQETEAKDSALLMDESARLASMLAMSGITCSVESSRDDIMRIMKAMQ